MGFGGSGGGGSIAGASDAAVSSPANNDVLTYDTSIGKWKNAAATAGTSSDFGYIFLDNMVGADDDTKLTAAIAAQQSTDGMPPIVLGARNHTFNQSRQLYSGLKLVGQSEGPKNTEQSPNFVTSRIKLGGSVSSGTSSWWVTPGGNLFDVYMGNFAVDGSQGSSIHQFIDVTTGSLYACEFHNLAFNFMRGVFGRRDRKCLITQVIFSGHWEANNAWDTQFNLGGSDCELWMGGYLNAGPSASPAQTGSIANGSYEVLFDSLGKTNVGYMYLSMLNGWRGLKVSGNGSSIQFYGGVYEGYKASGTTGGGQTLAAPGTVIRLEGGSGTFFGPTIGQGMAAPDASEGGLVHITGGEWTFFSPHFYKGTMAESTACLYQSGGRVMVSGATRLQTESWVGRPQYNTTATGPNTTGYSFYCPDQSMQA